MTAKEKLLERVETLSEQEAEQLLAALESETDEWGDLSKLHEVAFGETMRRLAEEEQAAGQKPW